MDTMLRTDNNVVTALATDGKAIDELLGKEWLLTNSRGGYASSTIIGCNTRRYHGLLVGSPVPLANRIVGLANCMEMLPRLVVILPVLTTASRAYRAESPSARRAAAR